MDMTDQTFFCADRYMRSRSADDKVRHSIHLHKPAKHPSKLTNIISLNNNGYFIE